MFDSKRCFIVPLGIDLGIKNEKNVFPCKSSSMLPYFRSPIHFRIFEFERPFIVPLGADLGTDFKLYYLTSRSESSVLFCIFNSKRPLIVSLEDSLRADTC
ncbi:hypothetical protein CDAR_34081 [Caerostris darwini]|uniref:Uncharacterized protein n=1 Tax=Caerostris darwini TaxID=1538125 RepID=A0AAV4RBV8_9ARAC|nr:hypothetical protein CDAR_34081 [Caerostris darwini]